MTTVTAHCPVCGGKVQIPIAVLTVRTDPDTNNVRVSFQDQDVWHSCEESNQ